MKNTKAWRHRFYKKLLIEVCKDPSVNYGLCYYIRNILLFTEDSYIPKRIRLNYVKILDNFPELYKKKPKKLVDLAYWFPRNSKGWEKRIAIVEQCIKETAPYSTRSDANWLASDCKKEGASLNG